MPVFLARSRPRLSIALLCFSSIITGEHAGQPQFHKAASRIIELDRIRLVRDEHASGRFSVPKNDSLDLR